MTSSNVSLKRNKGSDIMLSVNGKWVVYVILVDDQDNLCRLGERGNFTHDAGTHEMPRTCLRLCCLYHAAAGGSVCFRKVATTPFCHLIVSWWWLCCLRNNILLLTLGEHHPTIQLFLFYSKKSFPPCFPICHLQLYLWYFNAVKLRVNPSLSIIVH